MNTKILMTASAVFYGIIGIGLTFLPKEIAQYLGTDISQNSLLIFQLLGAGYWGFAMLNWMTRNSLIGGIYSRPLVVGNLAHFLISSLTLIKIALKAENSVGIILVLTIIYSVFALFFGYALIANPSKISNKE